MSTDLYERTITFDYGDKDRRDLMERVWSVTPWMIDCYTGSINSERERAMREWCHTNIGHEARPIHGRQGDWQLGGAVLYGWTWIGFAQESQMKAFQAAFSDVQEEGR